MAKATKLEVAVGSFWGNRVNSWERANAGRIKQKTKQCSYFQSMRAAPREQG